jgi:predicted permease
MQLKHSVKTTISKIIFSSPIAFFLGVGVFVATDILQPSYFKNIPVYFPYFIAAMLVGYLAVFLASSYISTTKSKTRAVFFMIVFMAIEGLFSVLAVSTYYGSQDIPILRIVSGLCLPLVFSLFYFLKIIEDEPVEKNVKVLIHEQDLFKNFDELERSKPDF